MNFRPVIAAVTTIADTWADVYTWDTREIQGKIFHFAATVKGLDVQILGGIDGIVFPTIVVPSFSLVAAAAATEVKTSDYYPYIKIQVKPTAAGQNGTLATKAAGSSSPDVSQVEVTVDTSGVATQTTLAAILAKLIAAPATEATLTLIKTAVEGATPAGTGFIGRTGMTGFKILQSFTRPSDGNAYIALDAITNSTSAPAIMSQDLASFGATVGRFLVITNARVISSVKGSGLSCNIWMAPATFAATNDNAEFSLDDTTAALGCLVIPCNNNYTSALNARAVSDPGWWEMQLGAASTTVYFGLQAAAGYTPASGEVFTAVIEGFFL